MIFKYRKNAIELPPIDTKALGKVRFSTKMEPFVDNERSFLRYTRCTSNVLADADRNDSARRAMRKDAQ